jgi:Rieske Fe-S protein
MTHGTIAGMLLTDLIAGRDNPWTEIYDPRRVTLGVSSVEELVRENVDVASRYMKDFLSPGANEDEIQRGEGRGLRRGIHKIAACRDESGSMHFCSAVCTHLKCIVGWNSTEKSWDCPCHGSRFDPMGAVINGPASGDLEKVEE